MPMKVMPVSVTLRESRTMNAPHAAIIMATPIVTRVMAAFTTPLYGGAGPEDTLLAGAATEEEAAGALAALFIGAAGGAAAAEASSLSLCMLQNRGINCYSSFITTQSNIKIKKQGMIKNEPVAQGTYQAGVLIFQIIFFIKLYLYLTCVACSYLYTDNFVRATKSSHFFHFVLFRFPDENKCLFDLT